MADNISVPIVSATIASDDIGGRHFQLIKVVFGADGSATLVDASNGLPVKATADDPSVLSLQLLDDIVESSRAAVNLVAGQAGVAAGTGVRGASTQRVTIATDDEIVAALTATGLPVTSTLTRPADITAYAADDCMANSTSAPVAGTLAGAVRAAGKASVLSDLIIVSSNSPVTPLQGEVFIFKAAPTSPNDNAAFTVTDADMLNLQARIPFTLATLGANSSVHLQNLGIMLAPSSGVDLRYLIRVTAAYTPASAETLSLIAKFVPLG